MRVRISPAVLFKTYKCVGRYRERDKIKGRPSIEQLLKEVKETNYCAVGRKYGVSDNAVRKWVKNKYKRRYANWRSKRSVKP